jgi:hypothetical protein
MAGVERWDVGPDEHHRPERAGFERAAHSDPEITPPLPDSLDPAAPNVGGAVGAVRRHRDPQAPAPVLRETAQQQGDHGPLEAKRCNVADIAGQPPLASPEEWRPNKQDKRAPHQP